MSLAQMLVALLLVWGCLIKTIPTMIEVFKTDVTEVAVAAYVRKKLMANYDLKEVSFDVQDCDHVLRIESHKVDSMQVITDMEALGLQCSVLPD
ncbi:MAG: hypothetical protein AAGA85_04345 [Bacteroidota bacterium]